MGVNLLPLSLNLRNNNQLDFRPTQTARYGIYSFKKKQRKYAMKSKE